MAETIAPFRADHVGSLLRPPELLLAREQHRKGALSTGALRDVEDRCIRAVTQMQEDIGLRGSTDGEYRRTIWHADFLRQIDGVTVHEGVAAGGGVARRFQSGEQEIERSPTRFEITGRLKRSRGIETDNYRYLASVTKQTPKVCIPSPTILHMRGGRAAIDQQAYPDMEAFYADLAQVYRAEIGPWPISAAPISSSTIRIWRIYATKRCARACGKSAKTPIGCRAPMQISSTSASKAVRLT